MKKAKPNYNKTRFRLAFNKIKQDLEYLDKNYQDELFGVCEGILCTMQGDLTKLYGLMLNVQDEKIKTGGKK